jgi:CubicO group peptidase (beta-lactamase class C family)
LIIALAIAVLFAPAAIASPALTATQVEAIRTLIGNAMASEHAPGATFAIGLEGGNIWTEGFGYADVENRVKATSESRYRTASIGKSMTATAAMELWERGKLDLDAPIQKYCPQFPEKPWPITARNLISHTSGIREPNETTELYNTSHYDRVSDALTIFANDPLTMRPGDDFRYTTWGYVVLGCVLEGATGEQYRALMQRMIFDPAGMTSTREDDPRAIVPNRAHGYILENVPRARLHSREWCAGEFRLG